MKQLVLLTILAACGAKQPTGGGGGGGGSGTEDVGPVKDSRTALEKRRDAACEALAPKMTSCAVEDTKRDLAAGKITQKQYDLDTASGVQKKNSEEFMKKCEVELSSRQVRVLEVCPHEETECDPLLACLENINKH
jgi:hypothetical protein